MIHRKGLWVSVILVELMVGTIWLGRVWSETDAAPLPTANTENLGRFSVAEIKSAYQQAVETASAESLGRLAEVYTVNGFFPEAEFCCRRGAALAPQNYDLRFLWGVTLDRLGLMDEAIEQFLIARRLAPEEFKGECSYLLGRNYLRLNRVEQAEQAFREGSDSFNHAKFELAKLLVAGGNHSNATPLLDELLASYPSSVRILQQRARVAEATGNDQLADELRDRAERGEEVIASDFLVLNLLALSKNYGIAKLVSTADRFAQQDNLRQAIPIYQRVLEVRWKPDTARKLALAEMDLGNLEQAVNFLEEIVTRDGETAERLEILGTAYDRLSKKKNNKSLEDKAVELWQRATRYPKSSNVHFKLAEYYGNQGNAELESKHKAMAHHAKGVDLFRSNKLKPASQEFAEAIKLDPEQAHSWYYVGELARAGNNREVAIRAYERCLKLIPHHGRAAAQLTRLQSGS